MSSSITTYISFLNKNNIIFSGSLIAFGYLLSKAVSHFSKKQKKVKNGILDMMKNTPLLYIKSLSELTGCNIYAKCEYLLPYTSKDRMIKNIILDAQK